MKTIKLTGILIITFCFAACDQANDKNNQLGSVEKWESLIENNFSITYPNNWELENPGQMGTNFILYSPIDSAKDNFRENINLLTQDLKGYNLDLDQFITISIEQIKTILTEGEMLESTKSTSNSLDYQKLIYKGKQGIYNLKFQQYIWVVQDNAFILTLTCEEDQFDNYLLVGKKILNSFKINMQ